MRWEADYQIKTFSSSDVHASELVAWAAVMKKDSAHSPANNALQPTSFGEDSHNKDEEATPVAVFVKVQRMRFQVFAGYGGRLKPDQEMCNDMWQICQKHTLKDTLACLSDLAKATAEASADKTKKHAVVVHVFANWPQ